MNEIEKAIISMVAAVLLGVGIAAYSANAAPSTHDIYLQQGDRFTVVCDYKGAAMLYGDNRDGNNPPTGIVGVCE